MVIGHEYTSDFCYHAIEGSKNPCLRKSQINLNSFSLSRYLIRIRPLRKVHTSAESRTRPTRRSPIQQPRGHHLG